LFPLGQIRGFGAELLGRGLAGRGDALVLPRFLRRPARWWSRAVAGDLQPPKFAMTSLSAAYLGGALALGVHAGGHVPAVMEFVAARSGLAIENVRVTGNRQISEIDVLGVLALDGSTSMLRYSAAEARDRVAALPWVERVAVRKSYPSTLEIELVERQPFAIWQSGSRLSLIDRDGHVIVPFPGREFVHLPLVIGLGAPEHAAAILGMAAAHPAIASRVKAYVRIGERRWDLRLDNGINIRLPDGDVAAALAELAELDRRERILSRDIAAIDLRLPDRLVVRLGDDAAARRAELVAARGRKTAGRGI
jgi:cell division protein FtsQ